MRFYQRHDEDLQINLTPLIDVVFLLLIFFMVSTTFEKESKLQIRLPESSAEKSAADETGFLEIQISESHQYAIKGPDEDESRVLINSDTATLYRAVRKAIGTEEDLVVIIRADKLAPHESVVRAMDVARRLNLFRITFATTYSPE